MNHGQYRNYSKALPNPLEYALASGRIIFVIKLTNDANNIYGEVKKRFGSDLLCVCKPLAGLAPSYLPRLRHNNDIDIESQRNEEISEMRTRYNKNPEEFEKLTDFSSIMHERSSSPTPSLSSKSSIDDN